jgi:hypothetical protein
MECRFIIIITYRIISIILINIITLLFMFIFIIILKEKSISFNYLLIINFFLNSSLRECNTDPFENLRVTFVKSGTKFGVSF